jgi:hypothetical protein
MVDTYAASSEIIGTIPTTFLRPTSCNTAWIGVEGAAIYYAVTCATDRDANPYDAQDTACFPSGLSYDAYLRRNVQFFSPESVCPDGFTSACNVTKNVFDAAVAVITPSIPASDVVSYLLRDGDTAVGCCPTGFECDAHWPQSCVSVPGPGATVAGWTYGRSCSSRPTTVSVPRMTATFTLNPLGTTASQLGLWLLHNPDKDNATSSESGAGAGLSTGAKIGLGVGVPLGVIMLAAIIFICFHRSRKLAKERQRQKERTSQQDPKEPVLPPHMEKPELQGSEGVDGLNSLKPKAELDSKNAATGARTAVSEETKAPELEDSQSGTGTRPELEGHASANITNIAELSGDPYRYELEARDDARWKRREG